MHTPFKQLRATHDFLARRSFYPLVLSSLLACAVLAGRIFMSRSWTYAFLVWNLALAWAPYLYSLWIASIRLRHPDSPWRLVLPGALWLIFFPNAPYIVTDFIHLRAIAPIPLWFDIGLLAIFAWIGCFLAVTSLQIVQALVRAWLGAAASWCFVIGVIGLTGMGIYLGRFLRWNSWDVVLHPRGILADVLPRLRNPLDHPQTFGVTFLFAAFLLICYLTFTSVTSAAPARRRL